MKTIYYILANEDESSVLQNVQEAVIDSEGWALIAPFGRFPKTRIYQDGNAIKEQKFIQVLDNDSADALMSTENSIFGKLKRALIGIPIFKGHGDLKDHDKTAIGNSTDKVKLGIVDKIRKTARGIEAHFALDNDGAEAVAEGWKFPSALWRVLHNGMEGDAILGKPFKLLSVALCKTPNISGVDSLANARPASIAEVPSEQEQNKIPDMNKLAGWLIAMGATTLANASNPTEDQVLGAMQSLITSKTGEVTSLGNEKTTLAGQITTLTNERNTFKQQAADATTALGNEQTARKAERKFAATLAVDLAIQKGKLAVAARETNITTLENSSDFTKDSTALMGAASVVKTPADAQSGKQNSALSNEQQALSNEYEAAFMAELQATGQDAVKAHQNVMTLPKYSGLACKLLGNK